ncbi:hypothetical protein [Prosthecobacter sp.]|uniref:hypothetical protein n=1 Tax=Prosthecobacter sp. TaxID=1965333 RepID=UPI003784B2E7
MELECGQIHSFFISMGGHWRQMDQEDVLFERENYECSRVVDDTTAFNLKGQVIERVWCEERRPVAIQIQLSGGLLTLTEGEGDDREADTLRFLPAGIGN